jgi:type VI secretion system FHA domain protein
MYLTLEVVSPQAASLGADRRRVVGQQGLTIGRLPGNDWVIPDPYISKQHARVSYANGTFFVEGLGRNAIAIGSPGNALQGNQPHPLRNGDHLFIDQYEMIVTTGQGDPPGMSAPSDDPFAVLPGSASGRGSVRGSQAGAIPDIWEGGVGGDFVDTGVIDPMQVLGGTRGPEPDPLPPVNWQHASVEQDHFEPPPVRAPAGGSPFDLLEPPAEQSAPTAPPPTGSGIPDNWDRTNLTQRGGAVAKPTPRPMAPPPPMPPPPVVPAPRGRNANRETPVSRPAIPDPTPRQAPVRRTATPDPWPPIADPRPAIPEPRQAIPGPRPPVYETRGVIPDSAAAEFASSAQSGRAGWPTSSSSNPVAADFAALMRGAGLSEQDLTPQMMQDLGKILRVVVEGVIDVLRARAEIKSQFRLPLTRVQAAENNPLKHSPNVESALHTLLVQKTPGFLSPVQAFEDAFSDIRNHQMAMLEGVRVAFESMLESFDPQELEKGFERAAKRGFGSAKSKYWDLYVDRFAHLGGDADDTFRRLFGDVFAEAYEKQLERLKTLARNNGKP